jgi:hypothetical protein
MFHIVKGLTWPIMTTLIWSIGQVFMALFERTQAQFRACSRNMITAKRRHY